MPDFTPLINGKSYEWADITVGILGAPFLGVQAIEYREDQDIQNVYGAGSYPVSRGMGKVTPTAKITLLMEEVEALRTVAPKGRLQKIPTFDIIVAFVDDSLIPKVHKIRNCRFKNNSIKSEQGATSIPVELEVVCSHIDWQ